MLQDGIIEESTSPWSSPIVVNGSICNDFWRLNKILDFEQLERAQFISTLDLTAGYWQEAIVPEAKLNTVLSITRGH